METSGNKLELSSVLQNDLKTFNNPDLLMCPEIFDYLLQTVIEELTKPPSVSNKNNIFKEMRGHKTLAKFTVSLINQWCGSLATFLTISAREDVSVNEVDKCLAKLGWAPQQIEKVSKLHEENQAKLRAVLKLFETSHPKLVDIKWRLDVKLETNTLGQVNQLWYLIDLILEKDGALETFTFTANHAQLEDLVATLKDAHNSAKKFAST